MKQLAALVILASLGLACNNELDLNADYQDIGLVYGLLNPKEDTQWVRIHRTYLGEGDPLNSVGNPDSLYYDTLVVRMEEYVGGSLTKTIPLTVDFTTKSLDSGLFTSQDYRLYRTTETLNGSATYRLVIEKPEGGPVISGETPVTCLAAARVKPPRNTLSCGNTACSAGVSNPQEYSKTAAILRCRGEISRRSVSNSSKSSASDVAICAAE